MLLTERQVRKRLDDIDRPRALLQALQEAIDAARLNAGQLALAINTSDAWKSNAGIAAAAEDASTLLNALKSLDVVCACISYHSCLIPTAGPGDGSQEPLAAAGRRQR